jgi:uncharacterized membrane protein YdbT with pleckstrin-like domain
MSVTTSEIAAFLESHHLFANLPPVKLNELVHQCELHEEEAGVVVYSAGDQAASLYLIYSGSVALTGSSRGSSRSPREFTRLQAGDFFGGLAMLQGARQFDTATLLQPTLLLALERSILARLVRECEPISARIALDNRSVQLLRKRKRLPGLRPQESVNLLCVPHWAWLAQRMLFPLLLLGGAVLGAAGFALNGLPWWPLVAIGGLACPAWAVLLVVDCRDDAYFVTDRRAVSDERLMIIHKTRAEVPLKRVRAVEVTQGTIEQIFGYGDVIIQAFAGQVIFRNVANPGTVRELILDRAKRARNEALVTDQRTITETIRSGLGGHQSTPGQSYTEPAAMVEPQTASKRIVAVVLRYFLPRFREQRGHYVTWRKHPLILIKRLAGGVLGIVFMSLVAIAGPGSAPTFAGPLRWDAFLVFGYGLFTFWAWYQFEDWRADVYTLTPERLIDSEKKPLLGRLTQRSAPIESVLNVSYDRPGILANIFNYGTVTIESGGEAGRLTFDGVGNPLSVQQEIFLRLEQHFERREDEEAQHRQREIADWITAYDDISRPPNPD